MPGDSCKKRGRAKVNRGKKGGGRKKQQKSSQDYSKVKPAPLATDYDGGVYYEAESIVAARLSKEGDWEYRVRWKGFPGEDTWEPECNLCDSLYDVARKLRGGVEKEKEEPNELDIFNDDCEKLLAPIQGLKEDKADRSNKVVQVSHDITADPWDWNDIEQIKFREIQRINVNDAEARRRVTEARESGIPVCLVGHQGWTNFARRWLKPKESERDVIPQAVEMATTDKVEQESSPPVVDVTMFGNASGHVVVEMTATESAEASKDGTKTCRVDAAGDTPTIAEGSMKLDENVGRVYDASNQAFGVMDVTIEKAYSAARSALPAGGAQANEGQVPTKDASTALKRDGWLDLTELWEVDVNKMIEDIGIEKVPVVRPHYNEQEPIQGSVRLAEFLRRCWPSDDKVKTPQRLYLHQWQFPLSGASDKLCGPDSHNPLPHDILGEDLLALWQDANKENPYQYIFMGRDETMSKLHRDPGGLAISIAPIVGRKEVVLVHRTDGFSCLSHLQASLDKIELNKFPLVSQARVYKSVIKPGEILLMPQGTFHQCRNVTPCLSYSRFHLDTVNLRAFLESCINGDAPEISHEEILWNSSLELSGQLDQYVDKLKALRKKSMKETSVPQDIIRKVDTLRSLRCISRAICLRFERGDILWRPEAVVNSQHTYREELTREVLTCEEEAERWGKLLRDIDSTLHDFRYRNMSSKPHFRPQCSRTVFLKTALEKDLSSYQRFMKSDTCLPQTVDLTVGSKVEANFHERIVEGEVKKIECAMHAALVHFDALPNVYDEFLPFGSLRVPVSGEQCADMRPENVKPGIAVVYPMGTEEYRGFVKKCIEEPFVLLRLRIGSSEYERWLPRKSILRFKADCAPID